MRFGASRFVGLYATMRTRGMLIDGESGPRAEAAIQAGQK
jgi:hypothetical protein